MTVSNTVLFTELVYTGSVNSSTNLPVNNFVLPQLTDYFPSGNPLRSCTTASLVEYTPNPQPALVKRAPQPAPINTFPGVPDLADSITYTAEANRVEPSPSAEPTPDTSSDDGEATATEDNGGSTSPPATGSEAPPPSQQGTQPTAESPAPSPSQQGTQTTAESSAPSPSQQESQTASESPAPPSATQGATNTQAAGPSATATDGSVQTSETALGTMTLTGSSTQIVGNSTSSQPSTWNYVCSAEGCTLASSSGATATSANASSTTNENASQTTAQSSSARNIPVYGIGTMFLVMVLFVLLG